MSNYMNKEKLNVQQVSHDDAFTGFLFYYRERL